MTANVQELQRFAVRHFTTMFKKCRANKISKQKRVIAVTSA